MDHTYLLSTSSKDGSKSSLSVLLAETFCLGSKVDAEEFARRMLCVKIALERGRGADFLLDAMNFSVVEGFLLETKGTAKSLFRRNELAFANQPVRAFWEKRPSRNQDQGENVHAHDRRPPLPLGVDMTATETQQDD